MYFWIWSWDFSFCSPRCREYGNLCAMYWACQRERSLSCGYSALVYHGRCEVHCINATIHVVVVDNRLQFCSLIFWHSHFILHGWKQKNHPGFYLCITFLVRIGNKHFFCQYSTTLLTWAFFLLTVSFQGGSLCKPICNTHWSEVSVKEDVSASQNITSIMLDYFVDKIVWVFICTSDKEQIRGGFWFVWILEERKRIDKIST